MSVNYHDGIMILWGCISSAWTGKLARAESNMDGTKDMVILSPLPMLPELYWVVQNQEPECLRTAQSKPRSQSN